MKSTKQRLLLYLIIIPLIAAILWLSYLTFTAYYDYKNSQNEIGYTTLIKNSSNLLNKLANEQLRSATHISSDAIGDLSNLNQSRENTNVALRVLNESIEKNTLFSPYKKRLILIKDSIDFARAQVDTLSSDYESIFFNYYHNTVDQGLIGLINLVAQKFPSKEMSNLAYNYRDITNEYSNISIERSFIALNLGKNKELDNKDLLLWESILSESSVPTFIGLKNKELASKLKLLVNNKKTMDTIMENRASIIKNSQLGKDQLSTEQWEAGHTSKLTELISAEELLLADLHNSFLTKETTAKNRAIQYAIAAASLFLLLFILWIIFNNINKESKLLEDTLKNIEFDLDKVKRKELREIVERKDAAEIYNFLAETIKEANQTKDLFLANMSHEIRTPLNGIVGFTQLLKSTEMSDDQSEFIAVIEDSSENLLKIVNDILDLSKIKADKIELESIPFQAREQFESSIESYAVKASQKDIEFSTYIDPTIPMTLIGDPTKLSQIMINLISNAIKFTNTHGTVDVFIEKLSENSNSTTLKFLVKDSGVGITDEQQNKIFEAFSQADSSTSRKFGGTGLGLAISSRLVSIMGGELDIESDVGVGSSFYFTLDFDKQDHETAYDMTRHTDLTIGLVLPEKSINRQVDKNLTLYINTLGATLKIYYGNEIFNTADNLLPDLLLIDHKYSKRENELSRLVNINTKVVLISTGNLKNEVKETINEIYKVIYKPINFSKISKLLDESILTYANESNKIKSITLKEELFTDTHALIAEDNIINQKLILKILQDFGLEVSIANNGEEAVALRKQNHYDIIFMDIQMPIMGGIEATQKILEFEKDNGAKHVPIIALTANALQGDREKYIDAGMDNYTAKPINIEQIKFLIEEYTLDIDKSKDKMTSIIDPIDKDDNLVAKVQDNSDKIGEATEIEENSIENILIYKTSPLSANIYKRIIEYIGYKTQIVHDEDQFLDLLYKNNYKYVLIDGHIVQADTNCIVVSFIKESGAIPLIIISNEQANANKCCRSISSDINKEELRKILK